MTRPLRHSIAAIAVAAALLVTGCSSNGSGDDRPTITPASPAESPDVLGAPPGVVVPAAAGESLAFDSKTRRLAAASGTEVTLYSVDDGVKEIGRVPAPGRVAQVAPRADGGFLVAAGSDVLTVTDTRIERTDSIGAEVLSVGEVRRDGKAVTLAGTATGSLVVLDGGRTTVSGAVEVSRILVHDDAVAIIDRRQATITRVDVAADKLGDSLRVGLGVTNAAIDPFGRVFAVDTGANQIVGYTVDPLMERFLAPVRNSPWAVDYDDSAKLMWVTETATNQLVGYALGSGMPEQTKRLATVRQPNAIAVDSQTGTVYVQSATGGGIQAIGTR